MVTRWVEIMNYAQERLDNPHAHVGHGNAVGLTFQELHTLVLTAIQSEQRQEDAARLRAEVERLTRDLAGARFDYDAANKLVNLLQARLYTAERERDGVCAERDVFKDTIDADLHKKAMDDALEARAAEYEQMTRERDEALAEAGNWRTLHAGTLKECDKLLAERTRERDEAVGHLRDVLVARGHKEAWEFLARVKP